MVKKTTGRTVKSIEEIMEQAESLRARSMYAEAAVLYRRALKNAGDGAERLECLKTLADTGRMIGRFKESAALYAEAVSLAETLGAAASQSALSETAAPQSATPQSAAPQSATPQSATPQSAAPKTALSETAAPQTALSETATPQSALSETATPQSALSETEQWRADALTGLGLSERALGRCDSAIARFNEAGAVYDALGDEAGRAFCRWSLAGALRVKGDIPGAIERFEQAGKMFLELGDDLGAGFSLCGLGGASRVKGDYQASFDYYTGANDIFTALDERFGTAYSYCGIGNALRMTNQYKEAALYLKKALRIYEKISDIVSSAYTLWSLGMLEILTARPVNGGATPCVNGGATPRVNGGITLCVKAEKYLDAAQKNFKKTGDVRGTAYVLIARAQILELSGKTRSAMTLLKKSEEITRQYGFAVEHCHTVFISDDLSGKPNDCHEKLGISAPTSIAGIGGPPYNIP